MIRTLSAQMTDARVHITDNNIKMGKTASISLPPIKGCTNYVHCQYECYALKFYKMCPECRNAWEENLKIVKEDSGFYFSSIRRYLLRKQPAYFRWHVAGDILNQNYLHSMINIAIDYDHINFLAFTKSFSLFFPPLTFPDNLSIILSVWPGVCIPTSPQFDRMPKAFLPTDTRAKNTVQCQDECEGCRICWGIQHTNKNLLLNQHRR